MYDYTRLVSPVRRMLDDMPMDAIEEIQSFPNSSYYIILSNDGNVTIQDGGIIIDEMVMDSSMYSVEGNIITFVNMIDIGASVSVRYKYVAHTDEEITNMIGDTISNIVEPMLNQYFEFGLDEEEPTVSQQDIDPNVIALFVRGTVMNIVGINLLTATSDAIMIRDGDTVINTSVASSEAIKGYIPVLREWDNLLKTVRTNKFCGVSI